MRVGAPDLGLVKPAVESIDLSDLAEDVIAHLGVLAEEKHQTLTIERERSGRGSGDRVVLRQALINLVDNAIKYTPEGGHIRIRVGDSSDGPVVDVIDNGPGVTADAATHIFNRFDRGSQSRTDGGAGLGLSIAKWAVEVSGGRLTLESAGGGGSMFRIALPAASRGSQVLGPAACSSQPMKC